MAGVPLLDLKAQYQSIRGDVLQAVERVLDSQVFIMGNEVSAFEVQVGAYLQVPHSIGCSSGSDALVLALRALGCGRGDGVICPSFTFFATAGAPSRLGGTPIFLDVDADTMNLSLSDLKRYIAEETETRTVGGKPALFDKKRDVRLKAVVPVHIFGVPVQMDELARIVEPHGIAIVEDAAQAIGAKYQDRMIGAIGAIGCFSFFPSKNLGAAGDGGLVTTRDDKLAKRMKRLRVHGSEPKYHHHEVGYNFRLDAMQAAILGVKLKHLPAWIDGRRRVARTYAELLGAANLTVGGSPAVRLQSEPDHSFCVYHQYVIRVDEKLRDGLDKHLQAAGIGTAIYYPTPLHLQPCFAELGYKAGSLPVSEASCKGSLALPVYPELTRAQQEHVVGKIAEFLGGK